MRSITRALLVSILAGVAIVVLIAGAVVFAVARSALRAQLDATLSDRAHAIGLLVIDEDGTLEFEYDRPPTERDFGVLVRITDESGRTVTQSPGWPITQGPNAPPAPGVAVYRPITPGDGPAARLATLSMHATAEAPSPDAADRRLSDRLVVVEVIGRVDQLRRAELVVFASLVVGGLTAALGSSFVVWMGVRRGLAPVRELSEAVATVEPGALRLAERAEPYPEELGPIVAALEQMLARLDAAMQRERRFTDAAAHELRTPIAELRTMTDIADRWPEPDRLRRVIGEAREVVDEMEGLLASLLAVARGGTPDDQALEHVALLPATRAAGEDAMARVRPEGGLTWTFEGDEGACWLGPRAAVTAVLRNLLDNAAAYTPAGGSVHVAVSNSAEGVTLVLENGPVSLDAAEVESMFEPFWRGDASRTDRSHRGLGLTIVDSLTSVMGIERAVGRTDDGFLRVVLRQTRSQARARRARGAAVP